MSGEIMPLRPVTSITVEEALANLRGPPPPRGVPHARWKSGTADDLSWYRGHQAGLHDAYMTIRARFPRVAKQLREAFQMRDDGAIEL